MIGKGGKPRYTTFTHELTDKLKEYCKGMEADDVLFTRRDGLPYKSEW